MNGVLKGVLIAFIIIYIVSPLDLAPGPIDDLIVALLGIAASQKKRITE